VLTWPLRRILNPRVQWTVAEVDARLGSRGNTRPPVHDRLDVLAARLEALEARTAELVASLADVRARLDRLAQTAEIERLATDEGLAAIMEQLRLMEVGVARGSRSAAGAAGS
jgi:hypothetical protein